MRQIVEMGNASCGDFGCGEVSVQRIPGKGIRCRDEVGQFTPCPLDVDARMGEVGMFTSPSKRWGKAGFRPDEVPEYGWGIVSTPNVRWPNSPTRTFHAVKRAGLESLRRLFPGRTRLEHPFAGTRAQQIQAEKEAMMRRRGVAGIGDFGYGFMGQPMYGPFDFNIHRAMGVTVPLTIEPHKVVIGNVLGGFLPGIVDRFVEGSALSTRTKGFIRFGVSVSGVAMILFGRSNSYVMGAGLALLPQFTSALTTWIKGLAKGNGMVAAPPAPAEGAVGQYTPGEKARLAQSVREAFGVNIQGGRMGQLEPTGYETIVPGDFAALSRSAITVAGGRMSGLGDNPFRAIGA